MESYRDRSDEDLAALYADASEAEAAAIIAEMARRDEKAGKHERDAARWAAVREEWYLAAHAQYLAAVDVTRGYLLSRDGIAAGIDEFALWSGSDADAARYASEELRDFWLASPRLTVSAYRAQKRRDRKAARLAAEDR